MILLGPNNQRKAEFSPPQGTLCRGMIFFTSTHPNDNHRRWFASKIPSSHALLCQHKSLHPMTTIFMTMIPRIKS
jgi:hypothetical protein